MNRTSSRLSSVTPEAWRQVVTHAAPRGKDCQTINPEPSHMIPWQAAAADGFLGSLFMGPFRAWAPTHTSE